MIYKNIVSLCAKQVKNEIYGWYGKYDLYEFEYMINPCMFHKGFERITNGILILYAAKKTLIFSWSVTEEFIP